MSQSLFHIVFAGGGTAGHLFPGLAVATELAGLRCAPRITFAGSGKAFERRLVAAAGFDYLPIPCAPMKFSPRGMMRFLAGNLSGYRKSRRFIRRQRTALVVGLGGYASVPMARAATALDVPLVLLEQNAFPGKATRWLAPRAELICTAYETTRAHLPHTCPVRVTGNPIRAGFQPRRRRKPAPLGTPIPAPRQLLVLGGSNGARSLNHFVPRALYKLRDRLIGWSIIHQTGPSSAEATQELYRKFALDAQVTTFVQNLPDVLRESDMVVCRAGATTLAEIAATAVPAVMIPYPRATDDHQRLNAEPFVACGAARMIDERTIAGRLDDELQGVLNELIIHPNQRQSMALAMYELARPDAAWQVAMMVYDLIGRGMARKVA
ncbi:MAG: undecaprenyldiphospho-muramoylpentapeptide beta-N-acetylglucosaminyltransferase [Pirellulales bacterium]|nr:undecaprenyldiphospho-muramoylpentapeptide beta-N-acetylglucosaminyltransferase [Pirellulales bacterium]